MPMNYDNGEVSFDIIEEIGVLSTYSTGWTKEINLVSWNGGAARYDIRDWDPRHERMSRGVTLQEKEMRALIDSLRRRRSAATRQARTAAGEPGDGPATETVGDEPVTEPVDDEPATETSDAVPATGMV